MNENSHQTCGNKGKYNNIRYIIYDRTLMPEINREAFFLITNTFFHLKEKRFRQRYLDMIVNAKHVFAVFKTRAKVITYLHSFLDQEGFLEVTVFVL